MTSTRPLLTIKRSSLHYSTATNDWIFDKLTCLTLGGRRFKYLIDHADVETLDDFASVGYSVDEIKEVAKLLSAKRSKGLNLSDDEIAMLAQNKTP